MMTSKQYMESLRKMKTKVYALGERVDDVVKHPATSPHVSCAAMTIMRRHWRRFVRITPRVMMRICSPPIASV